MSGVEFSQTVWVILDNIPWVDQPGNHQNIHSLIRAAEGHPPSGNAADDTPESTTAKRKRKRAGGSEYSVTYRQYATDVQGSVLGLLDGDGTLDKNERYEYDPYGAIENESQLNKEAKDNAIRFQGFAYDDSAALYDMQARHYRPEIGRFLSRDRYESSDLDFNLEADPLTNNLYAFAGGSPVNGVEWDGHHICDVAERKSDATRRSCERHNKHMAEGKAGYHAGQNCTPILCPNHLGQYQTFQQSRQAMLNSKYRNQLSNYTMVFGPSQPLNINEKRIMNGQPLTDGIEPTNDLLWVVPGGSVARALRLVKGGPGLFSRLIGIGGAKAAGEQVATAPARRRTLFEMVFERGGGRGATTSGVSTALVKYDKYPPKEGFLGGYGKIEVLRSGTKIDRFGAESGQYLSPRGTPFSARSLPPATERGELFSYEVVKPLPARAGISAPFYGQTGFGIQYKVGYRVSELVELGFLRRLE